MRKIFIFLSIILIANNLKGQSANNPDYILLPNNEYIVCRIIEMTSLSIVYRLMESGVISTDDKMILVKNIITVHLSSESPFMNKSIDYKSKDTHRLKDTSDKIHIYFSIFAGYPIPLIKNNLSVSEYYDNGNTTYATNTGSLGNGTLLDASFKLMLKKSLGIHAGYLQKEGNSKSKMVSSSISSNHNYNQTITQYSKFNALHLGVITSSRFIYLKTSLIYCLNTVLHSDSNYSFKTNNPSTLSEYATKGIYTDRKNSMGFYTSIGSTIKFSKSVSLNIECNYLHLVLVATRYETLEKSTNNYSDSNKGKEVYSTSDVSSSNLAPTFYLNSINLALGLSFKLR